MPETKKKKTLDEQLNENWAILGRGFQQWWRDMPFNQPRVNLPVWAGDPYEMPEGSRLPKGRPKPKQIERGITTQPAPFMPTGEWWWTQPPTEMWEEPRYYDYYDKVELYGQIIDVAGLLGKSPEKVEADIRERLKEALEEIPLPTVKPGEELTPEQKKEVKENQRLIDIVESGSLEDVLRSVAPAPALAAVYASLRMQANRLPTTDKAFAFGRKTSLGEDVDVLDAMARRQTQDSAFINEFLPQFESAIQGAQTREEVDKIQSMAQQLLEQNLQERMYGYGTYQTVQFLGDTKRNEIMMQEGTLLKAEYPKWWEQYIKATPASEASARQGFEIGFPQWTQKQEGFGQARLEKETDLYTRFPELYSRYKQAPVSQRAEAGGFMPWTLGSPETRAFYFKQREFEERPKARRTPQWAI